MNYKDAGVDVPGVDNLLRKFFDLKSFSAVLDCPKDSKLVLSCDGVGTKIEIAKSLGIYNTIGIDLVAMVVNDIITTGATPKYFMDYISIGELDNDKISELIVGIQKGCALAGCELVGGETAIMPGFYPGGGFDMAGFGAGFLEKNPKRFYHVKSQKIEHGDYVIGFDSSGLHSNGYSLVRKIINTKGWYHFDVEDLLAPTKIYVNEILRLIKHIPVKAIVNITGGGFDNIKRVLPGGYNFSRDTWQVPKIFNLLQELGEIPQEEMFCTFNMGIGMAVIIDPSNLSHQMGGRVIGKIIKKEVS